MNTQQWVYVWFAVYILVLGALALLARRLAKGSDEESSVSDFFRSSRYQLGPVLLTFTFGATLMSAFFIVGLPGFLYTHGLGAWPYIIFGDIVGMILLFFIGRRIIRARVQRPDMISPVELFCPHPAARVLFVVTVSVFVLPYLAVQISGVGKIFESATGGALSGVQASACMLLIVSVYSLISGFRGIALTDCVQGILLLGSVVLLGSAVVFWGFGSPGEMIQQISTQRPDLLEAPGPKGFLKTSVLISGIILFASMPVTQPQFLTRYLAVSTDSGERHMRWIAMGFGAMIVFGTLFVLPIGLGGAVLEPDLASGDLVVGSMLTRFVPDILAGLFMVGAIAAAMSTADSILFSTGQIFSKDLYHLVTGNRANVGALILPGRVFMIVIAVLAFGMGILNSELIVLLSRATFSGCLLLVPIVFFGLWSPAKWKHSPSVAIIAGVVVYILCSTTFKKLLAGVDPGIPAAITSTMVLYFERFFVRHGGPQSVDS